MDQRALCAVTRAWSLGTDKPGLAATLQRTLSVPLLESQKSDLGGAAPLLSPQQAHTHSQAMVLPHGIALQAPAECQIGDYQSPGASSLSTPQSSQLSFGSSPYSCTTRSSTPTSILEPPTTEKKRRTPFTVYDAQPQNFKNPLFGTKASPSPQLAAYKGNQSASGDRIDLGSPACRLHTAQDHVPGQNNMATPVANLSHEINAVATRQDHHVP